VNNDGEEDKDEYYEEEEEDTRVALFDDRESDSKVFDTLLTSNS
jgi:hypothetical protein